MIDIFQNVRYDVTSLKEVWSKLQIDAIAKEDKITSLSMIATLSKHVGQGSDRIVTQATILRVSNLSYFSEPAFRKKHYVTILVSNEIADFTSFYM